MTRLDQSEHLKGSGEFLAKGELYKTLGGFEILYDSHTMSFDKNGRYRGQYQTDCLSEEPGVGQIFLATFPGDPIYRELTPEEMAQAI